MEGELNYLGIGTDYLEEGVPGVVRGTAKVKQVEKRGREIKIGMGGVKEKNRRAR